MLIQVTQVTEVRVNIKSKVPIDSHLYSRKMCLQPAVCQFLSLNKIEMSSKKCYEGKIVH